MGVCDVPGVSAVCDTAGDAATSVAAAPFAWLADAMGDTAAWMIEGLWAVLDSTTRVDVTSDAYISVYNVLFGIAVCLVLILFFAQLISGLMRRDPTALSIAVLGLGKAVVGGFLVVSVTATLLEVTDQLSVGIVQATGSTMSQMEDRLALLFVGLSSASPAAPGVGIVVTIFFAGLAIVAAAMVWASLLVRKAVLLVAIVMAPFALSGLAWAATRDWFRRWAALVLALIVSKLVVVVVLLVATAQVSAPIAADLGSISDPLAGIILLLVAGFAPYMAYKFIAFAGVDTALAISAEQDTKRAVTPRGLGRAPRAATRLARSRGSAGAIGQPSPTTTGAAGGGASPAAGAGAGLAGGVAAGAAAGGAAVATAGPRLGRRVGGASDTQLSDAQAAARPDRSSRPASGRSGPSTPPTGGSSTPPARRSGEGR
ncbi:type IV secretion system protein [Euzebya sp.]|uniref:type IV secretion system protein n=1 Tax=Euzebya sp. TaxID=1971409 RepID=UPI0035120A32